MKLPRPVVRMVNARPKKNLFLCLDAFDTLYKPNLPVPAAYAFAAKRHGIDCVAESTFSKPVESWTRDEHEPILANFYDAFQGQITENPNYGKAKGLGEQTWWANVIRETLQPFLKPQEEVPSALISELLTRYSSSEGYDFFPDARLLFEQLKTIRKRSGPSPTWKWNKTIVAVISNSDSRVPSVLSSFGLNVGPRHIAVDPPVTPKPPERKDIDFVVLSYDVGFEKPNQLIFDAATNTLAKMLDASPKAAGFGSVDDYEKLYVGDSFDKDYLGAQRANWSAVLLSRSRNSDEYGEIQKELVRCQGKRKPVVTIGDLNALGKWDPRDWEGPGAPMTITGEGTSEEKEVEKGEEEREKKEAKKGEPSRGQQAMQKEIEEALERLGV